MFFLHTIDFADFTFIIIDVGELIFSGERVEVTVCENAQLIFTCLFWNRNRTFHIVWYIERTLTVNMINLGTMENIPFDTPCCVWIHITKIHVNHIHKNTIVSDEHIVILQSSMQYFPTWLPKSILQRVEEQLHPVGEVMVCAVCRQKNYI
jgi:hypothetical protein